MLSNYIIGGSLGKGNFGEVFSALHRATNEKVINWLIKLGNRLP
jgi:serine/threonine protein kinase